MGYATNAKTQKNKNLNMAVTCCTTALFFVPVLLVSYPLKQNLTSKSLHMLVSGETLLVHFSMSAITDSTSKTSGFALASIGFGPHRLHNPHPPKIKRKKVSNEWHFFQYRQNEHHTPFFMIHGQIWRLGGG